MTQADDVILLYTAPSPVGALSGENRGSSPPAFAGRPFCRRTNRKASSPCALFQRDRECGPCSNSDQYIDIAVGMKIGTQRRSEDCEGPDVTFYAKRGNLLFGDMDVRGHRRFSLFPEYHPWTVSCLPPPLGLPNSAEYSQVRIAVRRGAGLPPKTRGYSRTFQTPHFDTTRKVLTPFKSS